MATFKSVSRVIRKVKTELLTRSFNRKLGNEAKEIVFKRVKLGFGVDNEDSRNPRRVRFRKLTPNYIRQRRRRGVQGSFGGPRKSNLTDTGQLLDSMIVRANRDGFTILIPDSRRRGGRNTNAEVAIFVSDSGRPFFALTGAEVNILKKSITDRIRRLTRRVT